MLLLDALFGTPARGAPEIAGVDQEDLEVEINSKAVRIFGRRTESSLVSNSTYRLAEIQYGKFERTLFLPTLIYGAGLDRNVSFIAEFIRRFETEAQIVARLEHPNIVRLYEFDKEIDEILIKNCVFEKDELYIYIKNNLIEDTKESKAIVKKR